MKNNKFIKNKCKKCKFRYNDKDICNIRRNIRGELNCVNYEKATILQRIIMFLRKEKSTDIFWR